MYIRDLQSRVQFLRADLPAGFTNQALQDAARYVARKTGVVRLVKFGHVSAGQLRVDLDSFMGASADEFEVLWPTEVLYIPGMDRDATFKALLTPTSLTIPLIGAATDWDFYTATEDLTASDGVTSYPMKQGDVIIATNGVWKITEYWKSAVARDARRGRLFRAQNSPMNSNGYLSGYSVERKSLLLTPVPVSDVSLSIECAIVPKKEFDNIDLPIEAEDAVIEIAKSYILALPNKTGGGANPQLAALHARNGDGEVSLVRALAEGGYGDSEVAPPPKFGN